MYRRALASGPILSICLLLAMSVAAQPSDRNPGTRPDGSDMTYRIIGVEGELLIEWSLERSALEHLPALARPGDDESPADTEKVRAVLGFRRTTIDGLTAEPLPLTEAFLRLPEGPAGAPSGSSISVASWVSEWSFAELLATAGLAVARAEVSLEGEGDTWRFSLNDPIGLQIAGRCVEQGTAREAGPQADRLQRVQPCALELEVQGVSLARIFSPALEQSPPEAVLRTGHETQAWMFPEVAENPAKKRAAVLRGDYLDRTQLDAMGAR